jgi:hypothetical protein
LKTPCDVFQVYRCSKKELNKIRKRNGETGRNKYVYAKICRRGLQNYAQPHVNALIFPVFLLWHDGCSPNIGGLGEGVDCSRQPKPSRKRISGEAQP